MAKNTKTGIEDFLLNVCFKKDKNLIAALIRFFLQILSYVYGLVLILRFYLYKMGVLSSKKFKLKIINVGNITTGGTGKTPLVGSMIGYFNSLAVKTTVVTRGYKGITADRGIIADEPQMLKKEFPNTQIVINKNRKFALGEVQKYLKNGVVILDDALGHLEIKGDLNIICIDCRAPFSNGYLLPRGLMRLPFLYLKKADIFVLNNADLLQEEIDYIKNKLSRYNKKALVCQSIVRPDHFCDLITGEKLPLNSVIKKYSPPGKIALLCAVANPQGVQDTVKSLGLKIEMNLFYKDHHVFTEKEFLGIIDACKKQNVIAIITTAKDEPRLNRFKLKNQNVDFLVLKVKMEFKKNEERFLAELSALSAD